MTEPKPNTPPEPQEQEVTLKELHEAAQDGAVTVHTVIDALPPSQARSNASIFLNTALLWLQQAFSETEAKGKK